MEVELIPYSSIFPGTAVNYRSVCDFIEKFIRIPRHVLLTSLLFAICLIAPFSMIQSIFLLYVCEDQL